MSTSMLGADGAGRDLGAALPATGDSATLRAAARARLLQWSARWRGLPWYRVLLLLLIVTLIGSVLVPAYQTWRIMRVLRQTAAVLEPARLAEARLELALAREADDLEQYAASDDHVSLARYRESARDTQAQLATLDTLVARLGSGGLARIATIRTRLQAWHRAVDSIAQARVPRAQFGAALRAHHPSIDAVTSAVMDLDDYFAAESATRRSEIHDAERLGLTTNASLVLVALLVLIEIIGLGTRQRRLAALLRERVEYEERLLDDSRVARAELERVASSRSRLMRGFTHDIKNPLSAADGVAALLGDGIHGELTPVQRESIARIRRCLQNAFALIDYLHELARTETGNLALTCSAVNLSELATALVEEYRDAAEAHGLAITCAPGGEALVVETDERRVRQVLANLLSNAIKYTRRGSIEVRVRREPAGPDGASHEHACMDVVDSGPGIPPDRREAIFAEFVRLDNSAPGAGLGLAIAQRLAAALGGRLSLESEVGHGSTFTLQLPMVKGSL